MLFGPKLNLGDLERHSQRLPRFFVAECDMLLAIMAHVTAIRGLEPQIPLTGFDRELTAQIRRPA